MGSLDIPPAHTPRWVVPVHTACLSVAFLLWSATYVLMTRRSLATRSYGMPLLALATNVSWEIVNLFYVCEMPLEKAGLVLWLVLDAGLVYTTLRFGPDEWRRSSSSSSSRTSWVGRNLAAVFAVATAVGCLCHWAFAVWWLAVPGRGWGDGDKAGKWWGGREGYDTTEMAFWSSGVSQLILSYGCLSMLLARGHSGGTGFGIWFTRTLGTITGPILGYLPMWWYWPEAHGYVMSGPAVLLWGPAILCDLIYPFVLRRVRKTERVLPDGRLARGDGTGVKPATLGDDKKQR